MPRRKKTWREMMKPESQPEVKDVPDGPGRLLIPTPTLVAEVVRTVPEGRLISPRQIRERLAERFEADTTCPMCTGIFLKTVAGAAEEEAAEGATDVTPWWRVVQDNGTLNEKLPPGPERQTLLIEAEGHVLERRKRGKPRVRDLEQHLV